MSWETRLQQLVEQTLARDPSPAEFRQLARELADGAFRLGLDARTEQVQAAVSYFRDPREW